MKAGEGAVLAGVARNHAPERPRDPTGRHDDRSAGSLLDWDRASRITPGKSRVPGSADLGLSFLPWRKASAARGAPEGAAFLFAEKRPAPPSADLVQVRLPALRSLGFLGSMEDKARPRLPQNRVDSAWLFENLAV